MCYRILIFFWLGLFFQVGYGSDYDGISAVPEGLEDVSKFPNLTAELIRRGYKDDEIIKVCVED